MRRWLKPTALVVLGVVIAAVTGFLVWCSILYQATPAELSRVTDDAAIEITETPESLVLRSASGESGVGLLFIPGAKVEPAAYANKLSGLVEAGATVVITKPILNLAFFDYRSLSTFTSAAPDVDSWFVGGHSLGGVKACQFASDPSVDGLVLFGSYCANDLSGDDDLRVLSIGASEDGLSTPEDIEAGATKLPPTAEFVEIDGANHAAFGDYGVQPGDGTATKSSEDVAAELTVLLTAFMLG